jgi:hypothetical protein
MQTGADNRRETRDRRQGQAAQRATRDTPRHRTPSADEGGGPRGGSRIQGGGLPGLERCIIQTDTHQENYVSAVPVPTWPWPRQPRETNRANKTARATNWTMDQLASWTGDKRPTRPQRRISETAEKEQEQISCTDGSTDGTGRNHVAPQRAADASSAQVRRCASRKRWCETDAGPPWLWRLVCGARCSKLSSHIRTSATARRLDYRPHARAANLPVFNLLFACCCTWQLKFKLKLRLLSYSCCNYCKSRDRVKGPGRPGF